MTSEKAPEPNLDSILNASKFLNGYAKGAGNEIHKFVKGLILSKRMIKAIESVLPSGKKVAWGQIRDGQRLSKEIDAIVFQGDIETNWNEAGYGSDIGYFVVPSTQVIAIIEIRGADNEMTTEEHEKLPRDKLIPFCRKVYQVYLYAESKKPGTTEKHLTDLKRSGYADVFYLSSRGIPNTTDWTRFIKTMRGL